MGECVGCRKECAVAGPAAGLTGEIAILAAAYRRGVILFVTCLVVPFAALAFAVVHLRQLWVALILALGGCLMACGGVWLVGSEDFAAAILGAYSAEPIVPPNTG